MYAVIRTGGKQERVETGQTVQVELLGVDPGAEVSFEPVLVVDGDDVRATPAQLASASVTGRVVGVAKGPKVVGFTYKNKTRQQKHFGHRQKYNTVEITAITKG